MSKHMNARIALLVSDAQTMERLGHHDLELGLTLHAIEDFKDAANLLLRVCHHCDKRTRREAMRQADRLFARARRMRRHYDFIHRYTAQAA